MLLHIMLADADHVCQVSIQAVCKDIQEAENMIFKVESISGPVDTTVNAIGYANTALAQLDTFNSTYLQPLSTFNKVVMGIANVRFSD